MTRVYIDTIKYKNFKGFKDFELNLKTNNAVVSGRNGAGKSSLSDGFQWLLFGKDSKGSKLNPKPLDSENNELLGLSPTVEATVIIDGKSVVLRRVQEEKWTKKRGELESTRSSDTTNYFIDEVPKKESEWKAYIETLGGEALLQMLSNSAHFMSMDWKKRRELLMDMSGVTDEVVIENNLELADLKTALDGHSIDELKKILTGQKKEIKKEIEGIPARIQENTDTITKIQDRIGDIDLLANQLEHYQSEQVAAEDKLAVIKNGDGSLDAKQELANLKLELSDEQRKFQSSQYLATENLQVDADALTQKHRLLRNEIGDLKFKISSFERIINDKREFREKMLAEYKRIDEQEFNEHAKSCPTCGQDLPANQVAEMVENFNIEKSKNLEKNILLGKQRKITKKDMEADNRELIDLNKTLFMKEKEETELSNKIDALYQELNFEKDRQGKFEDAAVYKKITDQIKLAEEKIRNASSDIAEQIYEAQETVNELRAKVADIQASIQEQKTIENLNIRIQELKDKDQQLKAQNQDVERKLWLIDEFTRIKVSSIEESINDKFEIVKWKLFDMQKNGAIAEMCEATYNGVEYSSGLNNGARINCDLDIVNTLSKQFELFMPVFIDNAESVNVLQDISSQTIELQVTEDNTLKVEV
jgi:DNA repair exonuclease SbcCD ATPase subunit